MSLNVDSNMDMDTPIEPLFARHFWVSVSCAWLTFIAKFAASPCNCGFIMQIKTLPKVSFHIESPFSCKVMMHEVLNDLGTNG